MKDISAYLTYAVTLVSLVSFAESMYAKGLHRIECLLSAAVMALWAILFTLWERKT